MKHLLFFMVTFLCVALRTNAQINLNDSIAKVRFLEEQKRVSKSFNSYFNNNTTALYGASEPVFISRIDSLRQTFIRPLDSLRKQRPGIGASFYEDQYTDLNYTFDKFILDYIPVHKRITGENRVLSSTTQTRLQQVSIGDTSLLKYSAFRNYLKSLLEQSIDKELSAHPKDYLQSDNRRLDAGMKQIESLFSNKVICNRMRFELLTGHIEDYGVKNIDKYILAFKSSNHEKILQTKIDSMYQEGLSGRKDHLIKSYKTIGKTTLDLHIFSSVEKDKSCPTIVFFHGGGWSEGMPDWFFYTCKEYAAKGWVAVAVEYRLRNRHGTLPPDAIADGKSAIRYLRENAVQLGIDPTRIVVSGNSAGANLALALVVIDTLDDSKENLRISSVPNAAMLNSVATDLTQGDFWQQYFPDKNFLNRISPLNQVHKNLPPILILQGNKDYNVPLQPVIDFTDKMKSIGNDCELHILDGAGHFIWYDRRFAKQVNDYRSSFLKRLGY
ncbi:alpha/beta hydrolase [Chitinophagaceae bacterium LWZ2-11]